MGDTGKNGHPPGASVAAMTHAQRKLWAEAAGLPANMLLVTIEEITAIRQGCTKLTLSSQRAREEAAAAFQQLSLRDHAIEAKDREILALKARIHHLERR